MHWAFEYLGKPWTRDGFGPDSFHCWGLVWHVYRTRYGVELPKYSINPMDVLQVVREMEKAANSLTWQKLEAPEDGCVVAMSQGQKIRHVGVFLEADGGRVMHACEGSGVIVQSIQDLRARSWSRIEFYKLVSHGNHR